MDMPTIKIEEKDDGKLDKYEVKEAAATLTKAKEIEADPELFAAAQQLLKSQHAAIGSVIKKKPMRSIKDLRQAKQDLASSDKADESGESDDSEMEEGD